MKKDKAVEKGVECIRIMGKISLNNDGYGYKQFVTLTRRSIIEALQITAKAKEEEIDKIPNNRFGFKYKRMCENIRKTEEQIKQLQKHINNNVQCKRCSIRRDNEDKIKQLQKENEMIREDYIDAINEIKLLKQKLKDK